MEPNLRQGIFAALCVVLVTASTDYKTPICSDGRTGIVHLFEWRWDDIADECERFLGPMGYCGVQTSPVTENRVVTSPNRPWWERYQPVSYKLDTRSGNEQQLKSMVQRCKAAGVRVYVDVVINHMCNAGGTGNGTGGTYFDANNLCFPGVPYTKDDFHDRSQCRTSDLSIHSYNNANEIRNCRLGQLLDLDQSRPDVQDKIAGLFNKLLDMGVAGFRIDAAKHMSPGDIHSILRKTHMTDTGEKPFIYQEVIDNAAEPVRATQYLNNGRVTNFKFGFEVSRIFRHQNALKWTVNWGVGWGMLSSGDVVNFVDNHDNQRGHGGGGNVLSHWEPRAYKLASIFMLAHPYGFPRIMSSYDYNRQNDWEGPPHNPRTMETSSVDIEDGNCTGGWACEHRYQEIRNMVAFRNMAAGAPLTNWWVGGDYLVAFSRGDKAFVLFNMDNVQLRGRSIKAGLPAGIYCDVISGDINSHGTACTGDKVFVNSSGNALIKMYGRNTIPVIAIHVGAKIGSSPKRFPGDIDEEDAAVGKK